MTQLVDLNEVIVLHATFQTSKGSIKVQFEIVEEEGSAPLEEIVDKMETEVC